MTLSFTVYISFLNCSETQQQSLLRLDFDAIVLLPVPFKHSAIVMSVMPPTRFVFGFVLDNIVCNFYIVTAMYLARVKSELVFH